MKEIGIEKLIELLNEYEYFKELKEVPEEEKDLFVQKIFWHESYGVLNSYGCEDYEILKRKFCYMYAISKEYGFIKWLVENDKISNDGIKPRTDLVKEITIVDYKTGDAIGWKNKYTEVEQLIMYLSIQDEPIRFLCEILK